MATMKRAVRWMAVAVVASRSLVAQSALPGWYTETRTQSTPVGERAAVLSRSGEVTRRWEAGGFSRTEGGAASSLLGPGAYTLIRAGDNASYEVIPSKRQVRMLDRSAFSALRARGQLQIPDLSDVTMGHVKDLGDGGVVLGHRTVKREAQFSMMERGPARGAKPHRVTTTITTWEATDTTDSVVSAYRAWRRAASASGRAPRGMVLRTESRSAGQLPADVARSSEVLVWRRQNTDTSLFAVPANFARIDAVKDLENRQAALAEIKRLFASPDPKDRARARHFGDSIFQTMPRDTARLRQMMREHATVVTDSVPARKKPRD